MSRDPGLSREEPDTRLCRRKGRKVVGRDRRHCYRRRSGVGSEDPVNTELTSTNLKVHVIGS